MKRTQDEYASLLEKDGKFKALEEYRGSTIKTRHECLKCNYVWEVRPQQLLKANSGCPSCGRLKDPLEVKNFLLNKGFETLSEYMGHYNQ